MSLTLPAADLTSLALRAADRVGTNGWLAAISPDFGDANVASQLVEEIEGLGDAAVAAAPASSPDGLPAELSGRPEPILVLSGMDGWTVSDWRRLDVLRDALPRTHVVMLVLSANAWSHLTSEAPHLASWVSGAWAVDTEGQRLSEEDRAMRLVALREQYGWEDEAVVAMATAGTLPAEPDLAEWLVLLGRGDLVDPR